MVDIVVSKQMVSTMIYTTNLFVMLISLLGKQ